MIRESQKLTNHTNCSETMRRKALGFDGVMGEIGLKVENSLHQRMVGFVLKYAFESGLHYK